jgi:hypothetical protein
MGKKEMEVVGHGLFVRKKKKSASQEEGKRPET